VYCMRLGRVAAVFGRRRRVKLAQGSVACDDCGELERCARSTVMLSVPRD